MPDVVVRTAATADIGDIFRFSVAKFGRTIAEDYLGGLDIMISRLGEFPGLGAIQRGLSLEVRALTYLSHRIFYEFDGSTVFVVRILHHAMDAASRLDAPT